jgi:hypothetical protein
MPSRNGFAVTLLHGPSVDWNFGLKASGNLVGHRGHKRREELLSIKAGRDSMRPSLRPKFGQPRLKAVRSAHGPSQP